MYTFSLLLVCRLIRIKINSEFLMSIVPAESAQYLNGRSSLLWETSTLNYKAQTTHTEVLRRYYRNTKLNHRVCFLFQQTLILYVLNYENRM